MSAVEMSGHTCAQLFRTTVMVESTGFGSAIDITSLIREFVSAQSVADGVVFVSVEASTAGIVLMAFDEGTLHDLRDYLSRAVPWSSDWLHHRATGDSNGAAHIRSALLGLSIQVAIAGGRLTLGERHRAVMFDFDDRTANRQLHMSVLGTVMRAGLSSGCDLSAEGAN